MMVLVEKLERVMVLFRWDVCDISGGHWIAIPEAPVIESNRKTLAQVIVFRGWQSRTSFVESIHPWTVGVVGKKSPRSRCRTSKPSEATKERLYKRNKIPTQA